MWFCALVIASVASALFATYVRAQFEPVAGFAQGQNRAGRRTKGVEEAGFRAGAEGNLRILSKLIAGYFQPQ